LTRSARAPAAAAGTAKRALTGRAKRALAARTEGFTESVIREM